MNIIVAMIFGLKRAPESRMHQNAPFRRRTCQNFSSEGAHSPEPTLVGAFGASIGLPSALDPPPPDHISGYGPALLRVAPTDTIQILETEQRIAALIVLQASIKGDPVASSCRTSCIGWLPVYCSASNGSSNVQSSDHVGHSSQLISQSVRPTADHMKIKVKTNGHQDRLSQAYFSTPSVWNSLPHRPIISDSFFDIETWTFLST